MSAVGAVRHPGASAERRDGAGHDVGRRLAAVGRAVLRLPGRGLLGLLWIYQRFISPLTPPSCRYYPSCSQYAVIAIRRHGALHWLESPTVGMVMGNVQDWLRQLSSQIEES